MKNCKNIFKRLVNHQKFNRKRPVKIQKIEKMTKLMSNLTPATANRHELLDWHDPEVALLLEHFEKLWTNACDENDCDGKVYIDDNNRYIFEVSKTIDDKIETIKFIPENSHGVGLHEDLSWITPQELLDDLDSPHKDSNYPDWPSFYVQTISELLLKGSENWTFEDKITLNKFGYEDENGQQFDLGSPTIAIDIDGVIRPLVPNIEQFYNAMLEEERLSYGFDALSEHEQQTRLKWSLDDLDKFRFWGVSVNTDAKSVEENARRNHLETPDGENPDSVKDKMQAASFMATRGEWPQTFHGGGDFEDAGTGNPDDDTYEMHVIINPWVGKWINSLLDRGVKVVWSTTWSKMANSHFGKLLNVDMPVGVGDHIELPFYHEDSFEWKRRCVHGVDEDNSRYPKIEKLVLFIDDMANHSPDDLHLAPNPKFGLTMKEAELVEQWLTRTQPNFEPLTLEQIKEFA